MTGKRLKASVIIDLNGNFPAFPPVFEPDKRPVP